LLNDPPSYRHRPNLLQLLMQMKCHFGKCGRVNHLREFAG
jgi:hypothetical protein